MVLLLQIMTKQPTSPYPPPSITSPWTKLGRLRPSLDHFTVLSVDSSFRDGEGVCVCVPGELKGLNHPGQKAQILPKLALAHQCLGVSAALNISFLSA